MSVLSPLIFKSISKPTRADVFFGFATSPALLGVGALGIACAVQRGGFHPAAVMLLGLAIFLWVVSLFPNFSQRVGFNSSTAGLLSLIIVVQIAWSALTGTGLSAYLDIPPTIRLSPMIALLIAIPLSLRRPMIALALAIFAFAFAVITTMLLTPPPLCDVWMFQQGAARSFVNGFNPYHTIYYSPYEIGSAFYGPGIENSDGSLNVSFPYPPASLLMVMPGYLLGDVRYALLGWWLIGAVSLALIGLGKTDSSKSLDESTANLGLRICVLVALALLSSPHALMLVLTGWSESILIGLVGLTALCIAKRPSLAWLPLGLLFASKQYLIVLAPVTLLFLTRPLVMKSLLVAVVLTLPFLYADREAFYRSVVDFHFIQPFRIDGLTFSSFFDQTLGLRPLAILPIVFVVVVAWMLRRNLSRDASMWFIGSALTLVVFFACSKQAFGNYFL
ncbi:MAG TPA: hypothetical protein PK402_10565, partial [Tepidisphaeraceae bacterium]|nr:hypothetical protein [Tepidisphaeraceae bacterium]